MREPEISTMFGSILLGGARMAKQRSSVKCKWCNYYVNMWAGRKGKKPIGPWRAWDNMDYHVYDEHRHEFSEECKRIETTTLPNSGHEYTYEWVDEELGRAEFIYGIPLKICHGGLDVSVLDNSASQ